MALTYNGEGVTLVEGAATRAEQEPFWEVKGQAAAEYRLTELGQVDPAGRFRLRAAGGVLYLQKKTGVGVSRTDETWKSFLSVDDNGVFVEPLNATQSELLEVMHQYLKEIREVLTWAVEGGHDHE